MEFFEVFKFLQTITVGGIGIWTGVFMLAAYLVREWRETKQLSSKDKEARRLGYAAQVDSLQDENRALREDLHKVRKEYDDYRTLCQTETDQLRTMLINLQYEVTGLKRKQADLSIEIAKREI